MHPRAKEALEALDTVARRGPSAGDRHEAELVRRWARAWRGDALRACWRDAEAAWGRSAAPREHVGVLLPGNVGVAAWQQIGEALLAGAARIDVAVIAHRKRSARSSGASEGMLAALNAAAPRVAARVHITNILEGDAEAAKAWLAPLEALVAAGSDAAMQRWRGWWAETGAGRPARWQGHRVSVVCWQLGGASLAPHATAIAEDALMGDGAGCMSPRLVVIAPPPDGAAPDVRDAVDALARALAEVGAAWPARPRSLARHAAHRLHIEELGLDHDAREPGGDATLLVRGVPAAPAVDATDALYRLGPGHRALVVWRLPRGVALLAALGPHLEPLRPWLGTLVVAGDGAPEPSEGRAAGFVRVVAAGRAQSPGPTEVQDGAPPLHVFWR